MTATIFMWKCVHNVAPEYLREFCDPVKNVASYPWAELPRFERLLLCPRISGAYAPEFRGPKFRSSPMSPNFRGQFFCHYAMPPNFGGRNVAVPLCPRPNFRNSLVVLCYGNLIIPHFYVIYSVCSICHRSETHA